MTTQSGSTTYTPSEETLANAERLLSEATPRELAQAELLYVAYGSVTGGRSAVSGAELPSFDFCRPLVRAGWLVAARALESTSKTKGLTVPLTVTADISDVESKMARVAELRDTLEEGGTVDPFLMGIREISSSTRDLAEAGRALGDGDEYDEVRHLINDVATTLRSRVSALATPSATA